MSHCHPARRISLSIHSRINICSRYFRVAKRLRKITSRYRLAVRPSTILIRFLKNRLYFSSIPTPMIILRSDSSRIDITDSFDRRFKISLYSRTSTKNVFTRVNTNLLMYKERGTERETSVAHGDISRRASFLRNLNPTTIAFRESTTKARQTWRTAISRNDRQRRIRMMMIL